MKCSGWSLALTVACLIPGSAWAQGPFFRNPYGFGIVSGSLTYTRGKPGRGLSLSIGGFGVRGGYVLDPFAPVYSRSFGRVTTIYYNALPPPPPVIVVNPPLDLGGLDPDLIPRNRLPAPPERLPEPAEAPLAGEPRGRFRPLAPEDRARAEKPIPPAPPEPRREGQVPREEAPRPPKMRPSDEGTRLVELGRESFAIMEYGRAALRFRQATRVSREGLPHFLLAQALLAQGKYHDALDAILAGLDKEPDWPRQPFRPLDLYGPQRAEYTEHRRTLESTLERHPQDPVLLFLTAYQWWFEGRREEARPLFRRARPGLRVPAAVDGFLRALPAEPVL